MNDNKISLRTGYAPNYTEVNIGGLTLHFSYNTLIALDTPTERIVSENIWSPTTGKHIGYVDGGSKGAKAKRLTPEAFKDAVDAALGDHGFRI
jgi:hypothetical protein